MSTFHVNSCGPKLSARWNVTWSPATTYTPCAVGYWIGLDAVWRKLHEPSCNVQVYVP